MAYRTSLSSLTEIVYREGGRANEKNNSQWYTDADTQSNLVQPTLSCKNKRVRKRA